MRWNGVSRVSQRFLMSGYLASFTSPEGEYAYIDAYDAVLKRWPVPYEELDIPTGFGTTHLIASGSPSLPSLLLLHATGTSSTMWFPNIGPLSRVFRVFAVDIIGEPGKSRQVRLLKNREDCATWLCDLIKNLGITRTGIAGLSYGGWQTLNFALHHPDKVNRIAALAPAGSILPYSWPVLALLRILPYLPVKPNPLKRFFRQGFCPDELFARQFALGVQHFRYADPRKSIFTGVFSDSELRSIHTPTLFLAGENEVIYRPGSAIDRVKQMMPEVTATLIPDAGHLVSMDQPALVNEQMLKYL
jgi:pimeloyl-ACP methyl ester carboxylesterase